MQKHRLISTFAPKSQALAALAVLAGLMAPPALAQNFPITPGQRTTAEQVAQAGVPLSELASNAPEEYTVKRGDTLWGISGLFLTRPWRWPELWGMNMDEVANPHRIYPGQQLVLDKSNGRARLRMAEGGQPDTVRVSPRVRVEQLADGALPTLKSHLIDPFLTEAVIVDEPTLQQAPRIVAAGDSRVLITRGDRAYARGATPLKQQVAGRSDDYRVFRSAKPLMDPQTRAILGYEAQYLGKASLVRDESIEAAGDGVGEYANTTVVPATIDVVSAKEEMRVGDRMLPEPKREFQSYVPHAP